MPERYTQEKIDELIGLLTDIVSDIQGTEKRFKATVDKVPLAHKASARNLLHYLGLRQHDICRLQEELSVLGLSSLGRCESHVMATLEAVLLALHLLADRSWSQKIDVPVDTQMGPSVLERNTQMLLGDSKPDRHTHIMVTMPSEAGQDYDLVRNLLKAGMSVMRINSAHDGVDVWKSMIANLNRAKEACDLPCQVLIDLCGPKLRTGSLGDGIPLLHWQPVRDMLGRVVAPAKIWITRQDLMHCVPEGAEYVFALDDGLLQKADVGDGLKLKDARGKKRTLHVIEKHQNGIWAECDATAYLKSGELVTLYKRKKKSGTSVVGNLPRIAETVRLHVGDRFWLTQDAVGTVGARKANGSWKVVPRVPCILPEVFARIKVGERILFDDNAIAGVVRKIKKDEIEVEVIRAKPNGTKLGADKGINLPDTVLELPALSEMDLLHLDFAVAHADMVGLSFLRDAEDVQTLLQQLALRKGEHLGIVLKIENRLAFENLGEILLTALTSPPVAVMIARGDLAAEMGFERLAEVQEEILWLCEAAHIPVIWATQVLEQLAKKGLPSRAEVTDAAMGARAECVMLNKGPYVVETVKFLDDVLKRMQRHQWKKTAMLRKLSISDMGV